MEKKRCNDRTDKNLIALRNVDMTNVQDGIEEM